MHEFLLFLVALAKRPSWSPLKEHEIFQSFIERTAGAGFPFRTSSSSLHFGGKTSRSNLLFQKLEFTLKASKAKAKKSRQGAMTPLTENRSRESSGGSSGELTWLGRTHFSRSICYRLNSSVLHNPSLPLLKDSYPEGFIKLQVEPKGQSSSQDSVPNEALRSSKFSGQSSGAMFVSLSAENSQPLYTSNSVETSPEKTRQSCHHHRSLSLPSKGSKHGDKEDHYSSEEYSGDGSKVDDGGQSDVARATSWSEYFVTSGNEFAVEEAEEWMVDLSELFLGHKFASGAHSRLYLGKYKDSAVAVKILRKPDDNEEISRRLERQFRCEVNVLSRVQHRNIIKFVGACKKPPVCCIITEYLSHGSVRSYLHNQQPFPLSLKLVIGMALDIARGMEYLHSQGVTHRDLKSENLVIADDLCVKVTDFGVACFESEASVVTDDVGTYRWMAPEMISSKHFSRKADVYSFGIVLWELLTGHVPFEDLSPVQAAFAVVHKHARPSIPVNCPSAVAHLMHQCWSTDPDKRPEFSTVVEVLEEMQEAVLLERNMSILQRRHKHTNALLRCFGCCASKSPL